MLIVPLFLTCGPAVFATFAVVDALKGYKSGKLRAFPVGCVGGAWLITFYAAYIFLRYTLKPSPDLPPWKDPETLDLGLLFLLAPIGLVLTMIAGLRGASRWAVVPLVAALLVLFLVGILEGASV
jgi:hypothetical protein